MLLSARTKVGLAVTSIVTLGLVPGGATSAVGGTVAARSVALPLVRSTVTPTSFTVSKHTVQAGRIELMVTGKQKGGTLGILKFKHGYTWKQFNTDIFASFTSAPPEAAAAITKVNHGTTFFGGVGASGGRTRTGTVVVPKAGTYWYFHFTNNGILHKKLTVTGPAVKRPEPHVDGTAIPMTGAHWGGDTVFPHQGTARFKNEATDSPHFWDVAHVAKGTTKADVMNCFMNNQCGFFRKGGFSVEVTSPGHSMTVDYDVDPGWYVEMCFYTDATTGLPHAIMGMVRIIHFK